MLNKIKAYYFPLFLTCSIIAGCITGYVMGPRAAIFKPLGDIFLNLLFTVVVPLVFFSLSSSITQMGETKKLIKLIMAMFAVFIFTGVIAALFMIFIVTVFPPAEGVVLQLGLPHKVETINLADQIVRMITVPDFSQLFSHKNMLPLILFSLLVGLASATINDKNKIFSAFLQSGTEVFMRVITYVMYFAPIGFFAYFAVLTAEIGPQLIHSYFRVLIIYYASATVYFVLAFTLYAFLAGGKTVSNYIGQMCLYQ